jgi:hypothetical protein
MTAELRAALDSMRAVAAMFRGSKRGRRTCPSTREVRVMTTTEDLNADAILTTHACVADVRRSRP